MDTLPFYCAICGAANQAGSETCFACGQSLQAAAQADPYPRVGPLAPRSLLNRRYRIISQVGTGGFGAVYKAADTQSGDRLVAIKEINLRGLKPQEIIEATDSFNREVTLLTDLTHPHLPKVYEHFTDPEHWYLVMDFIEGETLEEYLQKTREHSLPLDEVLNIAIQLCTVLDYLHARQPPVIFRDLKPDNIMRTPNGHLYLIDFGTARQFKPGQAKDTIALGSPGYAAPEQYGKAQTTQRSDVYSLGVTLHHLLTGNDPSENPFRLAPLRASQAALPLELETLIEQMLELDARKRPASMAAVKEDVERITLQRSKALYTPQPSTVSNQAVPPLQAAAGVKANKGIFLPWAAVVSKRLIINIVFTGIALLVVLGSCSFFIYLTRPRMGVECGSCSPLKPRQAPLSQQIYRSPLVGVMDNTALDPALARDAQSSDVINMLFSGLVGLYNNFGVGLRLASSYSMSADGLHWTFHLRPNLKFSDGTPLTSADVAYSIDRALQPATGSSSSLTYLGLIKDAGKLHEGRIATIIGDSILTPDSDTIVITISRPATYFLKALSYPSAYVVEKKLIKEYGSQKFIDHLSEGGGNGPFMLQRYISGKEIDLVPNPNYFGPQPQLQRVIFTFYRDEEASFQAYQAGQVDTTVVPQALYDKESYVPDSRQVAQLTTYYYAMNYLVKPFDNIHIRQAFALAIDKNAIVNTVWKYQYFPTNHIVPSGMMGYNSLLTGPDGTQSTSGNLKLAQDLLQQGLQEEGWSSLAQLPSITFTYADSSPTFSKEVSAVLAMWQVLGIPVKAQHVTMAMLNKEIYSATNNPRGLQFWAANWNADYPDPQDWTTLQFAKGSPYNNMNYGQNNTPDAAQQQAIQQQLEVADSNLDSSSRLQVYESAEQQLVNDVAWMPMYQANRTFLLKPYVAGIVYNSAPVIAPDEWANIFIAVH